MSKPLIAIDIDDTLADSTETIIREVNQRYKANIPREAYYREDEYWGYYQRVWVEHGLDLKIDDLNDQMRQDEVALPLLPSALFAIQELSQRFNIVVITARRRAHESMTKQWLYDTFPDHAIDVHFIESHDGEAAMTKGQVCKQLGASYLIDDNVTHCQSAIDEGLTALLFGTYGWQTGYLRL